MRKTSVHATVKTACVYVTPIFFKKLFSKMSRKVGQSTTFHIKWRGSTIFREGRFSLTPDDARVPSAYAGIRQSIFANREIAFRGVQLEGGRSKNYDCFYKHLSSLLSLHRLLPQPSGVGGKAPHAPDLVTSHLTYSEIILPVSARFYPIEQ